MKSESSKLSWVVFALAFIIAVWILFQVQDGKKYDAGANQSTVNVDSAFAPVLGDEVKQTPSLPDKHLGEETNASKAAINPETPAYESALHQNGSFSGTSSRNDQTKNTEGNERLGSHAKIPARDSGPTVAQQMALRKRLSDKIVQQNNDRMRYELDRGTEATKKIREILAKER